MSTSDALKEEMLATDDEFRRLHAEHGQCEQRLAELATKSLLSQDDESEEKQIKRHKLTLKDRMAALMRAHEMARVAV
jgi:uncharacterized protein YdcH (DUF465 family)